MAVFVVFGPYFLYFRQKNTRYFIGIFIYIIDIRVL